MQNLQRVLSPVSHQSKDAAEKLENLRAPLRRLSIPLLFPTIPFPYHSNPNPFNFSLFFLDACQCLVCLLISALEATESVARHKLEVEGEKYKFSSLFSELFFVLAASRQALYWQLLKYAAQCKFAR